MNQLWVASLIVNNKEHLLRALVDNGASSSIILEAYILDRYIKTDDSNTGTWSTMGAQFTTTKTGICLSHFHSKSSISRNKYVLLVNLMWMTVLSHQAHMIRLSLVMDRDLLWELGIIMNFNDHTVTWDTDTIPMKDRDTCTLSSIEALIEIYMSANEPQRSEMNILELPKF
jgi:hypothetical protein